MSLAKLHAAVVVVALGLAQSGGDGNVVHLQESPADRLLGCVARTLGTRVFADPAVGRLAPKEGACETSREGLAAWLKTHRVILALTPGQPAYLYPSRYADYNPRWVRIPWRTLSIDTNPETFTERKDAQPVAAERVAPFAARFMELARPAPVDAPWDPVVGTEMAKVVYRVSMVQRRLRPDGPESVFALMGVEGGPTRLAYGEIVDGELRVRWDSPVFSSRLLDMGFDDVNGDGEDEMLFAYAEGANATSQALVIFDRAGRELTRQGECDFVREWDPAGNVCPIRLVEFELTPTKPTAPGASAKAAAKDIVVQDEQDSSRRVTYRLDAQGRYHLVP